MSEENGRAGGESLAALLAGGEAGHPALIVPDSGEVLTYTQVAARVEALAQRLAGLGVRRGDRVALALPNGPDVVLLLLAVTALGAAAAPLNPAYTAAEYQFFLTDIAPRLMLIPASGAAAATTAAAATGITVLGVRPSGETSSGLRPSGDGPPELLADGQAATLQRAFEPGSPEDVALILHTSGTTSRPKQVPLRQRNLTASARTIAAHYQLGSADVSFCVMPLFHIHGLVASAFAAMSKGGTVVVPRRFTAHRFWPQARDAAATWLSAGPTLHRMILDRADEAGAPASLRFARSCSSPLSPELLERAEAAYGVPMLEAYGMTEASHQMSSNPLPPAARIPSSVGIPTGTDIAVMDAGGQILGPGEAGEVVIRGPGVMGGYLSNPGATAEAFAGDWFRTGDRGAIRDGYLYLEGRLKEMILRGGENISPAEIEQALLSHEAVADAVCFGAQDEKYGEVPAAAVAVSRDTDPAELIKHCRGLLAAYKVPVTVYILPEIPRTPTGKVQRRRVGETILGARAAG
jgi:acyl-CoA synthetase (AMP-forming)/AMP-acid ligase II